jgi:release factor glutamine methyltransferase
VTVRHSVLQLVGLSTSYLTDRGVESPRLDAEVLLAYVLGMDRLGIYVNFDRPLEPQEVDRYRQAIWRRGRREPVAYIVGEKEFMGEPFSVSPAVLIPRPETELLVEAVVARLQEQAVSLPISVVDVGTGSGVIAVMLALLLPQAVITACDVSSQALALASQNAARHGVTERVDFVHSDMLRALPVDARYHCIVSNPPYIAEEELASLAPEVQYEPRAALAAGADGLALIKRLMAEARDRLTDGGLLAMEIGAAQAEAVRLLAKEHFDTHAEVAKDYAGCERFVFVRKVEP